MDLEDDFEDILGKAMRGQGYSEGGLAGESDLPETDVKSLLDGELDEGNLAKCARPLSLHEKSFLALARGEYVPADWEMDGVWGFESPFHSWGVNAFVFWDEESGEAALVDTGTEAEKGLAFIKERGLDLKQVFLTHTHGDHTGGLAEVRKAWPEVKVWVNERENWDDEKAEIFETGRDFSVGSLRVGSRLTWGHTDGGTTFVVDGLEKRVAFVGDALFAGSMGKADNAYEAALESNERALFSLVDEVRLCPGHGSNTTVGEEKKGNAFFAGRV